MRENRPGADRGQLSLPLAEAGVGVLLVFAVTAGFAIGVPSDDAAAGQLDAYAADVATALHSDNASRLAAIASDETTLDAHRSDLRATVEALLPAHALYRIETPAGALGYPVPGGRPVGQARVTTPAGTIAVRVWYA